MVSMQEKKNIAGKEMETTCDGITNSREGHSRRRHRRGGARVLHDKREHHLLPDILPCVADLIYARYIHINRQTAAMNNCHSIVLPGNT